MRRPNLPPPGPQPPPQKKRRVAGLLPPDSSPTASQSRRETRLAPNHHLEKVLAEQPRLAQLLSLELPTISRLLHPADESDSDGTSEDAEVVGRRVAALNRRSRRRIQQALKTAMTADCSRRELLEIITVSPQAERYYKLALEKFVRWSENLKLALTSDSAVDAALSKYMTELYLLGQQSSEGDKLLAGLLYLRRSGGNVETAPSPRIGVASRGGDGGAHLDLGGLGL